MKQLKLLMLSALMLLMGVSFTSCLDSDNDYVQTISAYGKLYSSYGSYYFRLNNGYTITPSYASVAAIEANGTKLSTFDGQLVYFLYTAEGLVPNETTKTLDGVTLQGLITLDNTVQVVGGKEEDALPQDSIATSPIITMEYEQSKPEFWDATTLLLPVQFSVKKAENYVTLVYYTDEEADNGDILRLHLRLNAKGKALTTNYTSYEYASQGGYLGMYLRAYNLDDVFRIYMSKKGMGAYPTQVQIVTQVNSYSTEMTEAQEKVYTVEYKPETSN